MKKGTKKENPTARKTRQANLNDAELSDLFNLSSDPDRKGSLGLAIRTVIERHKEQINTIEALRKQLKQYHAALSDIWHASSHDLNERTQFRQTLINNDKFESIYKNLPLNLTAQEAGVK